MREIGRQLNVETLLEGSVRKAGDRLHISTQLIDVADGNCLWSEQYDCVLEDVFTVQDEISVAITENLNVKLFGEETITKKHTEDVEAYNLYLKGRYLLNMGTKVDLYRAVEYFKGAIAKDPNYAPAYVGLADLYTFMYLLEYPPSRDNFQKAKTYALKAVKTDPSLAKAHGSLGLIKLYEWDWEATKRSLQKAIELNPNSASAQQCYALYLTAMGRLEDAIGEMKKALEIDPLSRMSHGWLAVFYLRASMLEKARDHIHSAHELQLGTPLSHMVLGQTYMLASEHDAGLAELQKAVSLAENDAIPLAALAWGYAVSDRKQEALRVLEDLRERRESEYIRPFLLAKVYCGLGDNDQAFAWLEKAVQEHDISLIFIKTDETIDDLRSDPRYADLLHRMNLGTDNK
jgi:tetratricopeptide (TPR) repeat protein